MPKESNPSVRKHCCLRPAHADKLQQRLLVDRLDGLRGMAWSYATLYHSGLSPSKASLIFNDYPSGRLKAGEDKQSSNIMYQYLRGERSPTPGNRGKRNFDLVGEVDRDAKGQFATPWLTHPIFEVFQPDVTQKRLLELFAELDDEVITADTPIDIVEALFEVRQPWLEHTGDAIEENAVGLKYFDQYVSVCAGFRGSQLSGQYWPYESGYNLLRYLAPLAAKCEPVFGYFAAPFLTMVNQFFYRADRKMCVELPRE